MEQYGYIPKIEGGVVFSDPDHLGGIWCQYRKNFKDANWLMRMDTSLYDSYLNFNLYIGRPTMMSATFLKEDGETVRCPAHYNVDQKEIGMDTAKIFVGSMKNFESFGESAALHTGTNGFFGDLMIFTCKGEDAPAGFLLMGGIDTTFADEKSLFRHMLSSFDGKEISREEYWAKTDLTSLAYKTLCSNELRSARKYEQSQNTPPKDAPER